MFLDTFAGGTKVFQRDTGLFSYWLLGQEETQLTGQSKRRPPRATPTSPPIRNHLEQWGLITPGIVIGRAVCHFGDSVCFQIVGNVMESTEIKGWLSKGFYLKTDS